MLKIAVASAGLHISFGDGAPYLGALHDHVVVIETFHSLNQVVSVTRSDNIVDPILAGTLQLAGKMDIVKESVTKLFLIQHLSLYHVPYHPHSQCLHL